MRRLVMALTVASAAAFVGLGAFAQTTTSKKEVQATDKEKKEATLTFEVYKDAKGEYRWRLKSTNSKSIGDSGEGYKAKADCLHGIELIKEGASKATIDDKS